MAHVEYFYRRSWPRRFWPPAVKKRERQKRAEHIRRFQAEQAAAAAEAAKPDEQRRLESFLRSVAPHMLSDPETARLVADARDRLAEIRREQRG